MNPVAVEIVDAVQRRDYPAARVAARKLSRASQIAWSDTLGECRRVLVSEARPGSILPPDPEPVERRAA